MTYNIIDVETTGQGNRITEISVFKYDGETIIDEFTSLVNPECLIPQHITALTGIDNALVANAPIFKTIAQNILDITEGSIFVAHNVNFDYNVINGEFKRIGLDFERKKLCTVRLSRRLIPGHKSYSLGEICKALNINLVDRHRARGDAEATVVLFKLLLKQPNAEAVFKEFLNKNSRQSTLPPNLPKATFEALPEVAGIYYFKDKKGKIIYVGKANNIKKRVLSHFYSKIKKAQDMVRETGDLDFEISGSELIALLMEDAAIKHHFPIYNKMAKRAVQSFSICSYEDRNGIIHLASNKSRFVPNPIVTFYNVRDVRLFMEKLCSKFNLCPKYCHLQEAVSACSHYSLKDCKGVCRDQENVEDYNNRVLDAIHFMSNQKEDVILKEKGRHTNEDAFVMIKNGEYLGYGFVDKEEQINHIDDLQTYLIPQKNSVDIQKILRNRLFQLS
ncbi:GIY-YIG nuclease family protein [Winogradskyella echinorum]|uniref:Excinuclease cho n=1 Tax=Winogradskyella echinorum TaxID=538189 RepID=A0ABR6Y235_9FLAO|nr:exonuclease domain-containing protein [Winogradskyella echinorum]MBC3846320.1 GIY-YIG nuclease family protein [Winogradskyella echinorum]MBC5750668.1 GIY-YIG nuclease family protein [Winogradskyella echinorum]